MLRYAITDRTLFPPPEPDRQAALVASALRCARSGINFLQLREKDLPPEQLLTLALRLRAAVDSTNSVANTRAQLLLNTGTDLALALRIAQQARFDGLHLTAATLSAPFSVIDLRTALHTAFTPNPILSASCHTLAEVQAATALEVDLILFSPVFGKQIAGQHVQNGVGLDSLALACRQAGKTPVLALGGITLDNTPACIAAGAAGIAAIRLFAQPGWTTSR